MYDHDIQHRLSVAVVASSRAAQFAKREAKRGDELALAGPEGRADVAGLGRVGRRGRSRWGHNCFVLISMFLLACTLPGKCRPAVCITRDGKRASWPVDNFVFVGKSALLKVIAEHMAGKFKVEVDVGG